MFPLFITVHEYGSGAPVRLNAHVIFSIFRPPGTAMTAIKSVSTYEQIRETPEEVEALIREAASPG